MSTTSSYDNSWSCHMLSPNTCVFLVCHPGIDGSTLAGATYWLRNSKVSCKYFYNPVYLFPTVVIFWSFSIFQVQGIGSQLLLLWVWPPLLGQIPADIPDTKPVWLSHSWSMGSWWWWLFIWFTDLNARICFLPHYSIPKGTWRCGWRRQPDRRC